MKRIVLAILLGGMIAGITFADDRIADRKENQQDRIANGVKNGTLSPGETARLEKQESNLNKEIRADRKANGGNLTNQQKAQVNRQQNHLSNQIYRAKHDGKGK
jgi:hypothetical protein